MKIKPIKFDQQSILYGLTDKQVLENIDTYGLNISVKESKYNILWGFLKNFISPVSSILVVSSIFAFFFGELRDSVIIILMVILSAVLNFYQEFKSSKAAEKLSQKLNRTCTVVRSGETVEIPIQNVTVEDIVFINIGGIIPADGKIMKSDNLILDESTLTGESLPVEKEVGNNILAGSTVSSGWGYFKAEKIGKETQFGQIQTTLSAKTTNKSYNEGVKSFSLLIFRATIFIVIAILIINISKNFILYGSISQANIFELILFSVTIAVGLTPELLPVIMSVNMASGAMKMSKKNVLVKRLDSIPDFGSMQILCTDKTGTLTENKIKLMQHLNLDCKEDENVFKLSYYNSLFQTGVHNAIDEAIIQHDHIDSRGIIKIGEIPYDFNRKRSSIIFSKEGSKKLFLVVKGQFESVLDVCSTYQREDEILALSGDKKKQIIKLYNDLSEKGLKILALATKEINLEKSKYTADIENDLILTGFLTFFDPPKLSAGEIIPQLTKYGIEIKIVTGDNELVTKNICKQLNIPIKGIVIGDDFLKLSPTEQKELAKNSNIFARFNPEEKKIVIQTLRNCGFTVGYMGDGINDAPSLKIADVGISVNGAVDIARESADIILLDKDFSALLDGVIEGRKTFANTLKYILMALSSNFGNMISLIGASFFIPFLPILPIQILLNNSLYDLSQLAIPTDNVDSDQIDNPKVWDQDFIRNFMLIFGPLSSLFDLFTFYIMYNIFKLTENYFQTAWFLTSFASQVLVIYILRTRKIPFIQSLPSIWLVINTSIVLLIAFILPYSFFNSSFGLVPLSRPILTVAIIITVVYLFTMQVAKDWFFKIDFSKKVKKGL